MKPRNAAGLLVALAVALAGCSAQAGEAPSYPESIAPTTTEAPATVENASQDSEPSEEPTTSAPVDEVDYNAHGNVDKTLEEWASLHSDSGEEARFRVTEISWDLECNSGYSEVPLNDSYLGLHVEAETSNLWDSEFEFMLSAWEAVVFRGDTRVNDPQGNGYSCMNEGSLLPSLGTGQNGTGWIILDVPEDATSVQLTLPGMSAGWEWQID